MAQGMHDYPEGLPQRILQSPPDLGKPAKGGPLLSPITAPGLPLTAQCICQMHSFGPLAHDESFVWCDTVDVLGVGYAPTNQQPVLDMVISEGYVGILREVGFEVIPNSAAEHITFQLKVSGGISPKFSSHYFLRPTFQHRIPFFLVCLAKRRIQVVAINDSANNVQVTAIITGQMRPQNR